MPEPIIPVVVLIGAGASYASADYMESAPPLTKDLFTSDRAIDLIRNYPLAQMAGGVIEREIGDGDAESLESALLALRTSENAHRRHMALGVPPFLQELLLRTSRTLHTGVFRYDTLIDRLSHLPRVHYISTNYDTLLDCRLHVFRPLNHEHDYITRGAQWSLIKPHGSVNWLHETNQAYDPLTPVADLAWARNRFLMFPPSHFDKARLVTPSNWFPALALPEGSKDEFEMPDAHRTFITNELAAAPELEVLVLGYSALDTEVIGLLRDSGTMIRRLTVVNRDATSALEVYKRIRSQGINPVWSDVSADSYQAWVDKGGLKTWVHEYGGPYDSRTEPSAVETALLNAAVQSLRQGPSWTG
jgi:hypothetical protein